MFFALVLIGCSFAINYDEDLDFDNDVMDAMIEAGFNYNQYWAGVPVSTSCILQCRTPPGAWGELG